MKGGETLMPNVLKRHHKLNKILTRLFFGHLTI